MAVTAPTGEQIRKIASRFGMSLSAADAETYAELLAGMMPAYERLDAMPDPAPAVAAPRGPGRAPRPEENPYGAWVWLGPIEGSGKGLLAGKAVGVKDNVAVAGWPLRNGSPLFEGFTPSLDATVVSRILAAGGTIQGKTTCEALSFSGHSHTSRPHVVHNPHRPTHSAGGSSSGSAAAIAAGDITMAIGGDQGGSIRIPGAWCGVNGLKPTHGLVPYTGICSMDSAIDFTGPMGATVEDVARLLAAIAGPDGLDSRQRPAPAADYLGALKRPARGLRIAKVRQGFGRPESEAATDQRVSAALKALAAAGASVEEIDLPVHLTALDIWTAIVIEGTSELMFKGNGIGSYAEGFAATGMMEAFGKAWRARPDDISPTAKMALFMGDYMHEAYGGRFYSKAQALRGQMRRDYDQALAGFDLLAMPTIPYQAPPMPPAGATLKQFCEVALPMVGNTAPFNASGHPAMTVPCGMHDGLPIGLQLVGKHFDEATVLAAAAAVEALGDWRRG